MGSSAKKKKDKKKDFQKPKYKVGKTKPKASNFTDTSFQSKAIVVGQQSLSTSAPDLNQQFKHNLSLVTSRSDKQRKDALAFLTSQLASKPPVNPVGTQVVLSKILPLISDSYTPARAQLIKLLRTLPPDDVKQEIDQAALFIRAGMTHLSADIGNDALTIMEWALDAAGDELVACHGGWVKTLNTFCAMMGWTTSSSHSATTATGIRTSLRAKDPATRARQLVALSKFLHTGLRREEESESESNAEWDNLYRPPQLPNAFGYLNLFGARRMEDGEMYPSREARQQVFHRKYLETVARGADQAKKEGGTTGRAASILEEVLKDGMADYEVSAAMDIQELLDLW